MKDLILNTLRRNVQSFKDLLKIRELYRPYLGGTSHYCVPNQKLDYQQQRSGRAFPIPPKNLFLGYSNDPEKYLAAGERDVETLFEIIETAGRTVPEQAAILDFGCGSGRMVRWIPKHRQNAKVFATDIDGNNITWCRANLRPEITCMVNTTVPHLPFEDRTLDLIYSGSVFTHIEDTTESWLAELRRILKPGGLFYVTIHDHSTIEIWENEWKNSNASLRFKTQQEEADYNRFVKSDFGFFTLNRWNASQVFYNINYFKEMVAPFFEVVSVTERAYGKQTGVLLAKPTE
jgi:ubiquinone/menaquinone biosynthesis C-methylase UbiE